MGLWATGGMGIGIEDFPLKT